MWVLAPPVHWRVKGISRPSGLAFGLSPSTLSPIANRVDALARPIDRRNNRGESHTHRGAGKAGG